MAKREGFQVPHTVVTPDDTDTWAVAEANDIKGGLHSVKAREDLEKIPEERQAAGMVVYVQDENKYYEKRGDNFVERKEVLDDKKPWTTEKTIRTDNYGATMVVPYVFMTNPKYQGDGSGEPIEYSAASISSEDVIVDSKMHAYSAQEFKSAVLEVDDKGFKLISKLAYDNLKFVDLAPGVEPFDAIEDKDNPAIIKPYVLKDDDIIRGQNIVRTTLEGTEQLVDSIINVHVKNLKKMDEVVKNSNGTYSAGTNFPLVFVLFNEDDTNVALGKNIRGAGLNTVSVGTESAALGVGAVSYGYQANAAAGGAVAVGEEAAANEQETVAVGIQTKAAGSSAVVVGAKAKAEKDKAMAIGASAAAMGAHSIVIGAEANASGSDSIAIGNMNGNASGERSMSFGPSSKAEADATIAMGYTAVSKADSAIAIGPNTEAMGKNSVAIGAQSKTYDSEANVFSVGAQEFSGSPELTRRIVHVADGVNGTDAVTKKQLDALAEKVPDIPKDAKYTDTTYEVATPNTEDVVGKSGLMSAEDKTKLDSLKVVDMTQYLEKPQGDDQYILRSEATQSFAPAQNDYLKETEMEDKFKEYAKKTDIEKSLKKHLYKDEDGVQPIYAKTEEVVSEAQVTDLVTQQLNSWLKVPTGGENSEMIDKYVARNDIENLINNAIEAYFSKHALTIDEKNQINIGVVGGDGVDENKDENKAAEGGTTEGGTTESGSTESGTIAPEQPEDNGGAGTDNPPAGNE